MIADEIDGAIVRPFSAPASESGQTLVEYALIGMLLVVVLAAVLTLFGGSIAGAVHGIAAAL